MSAFQSPSHPPAGVICDRRSSRDVCDYQAQMQCVDTPLIWGEYCAYENHFVGERYRDLVKVFDGLKKYFTSIGLDGFKLNHTVLWEVCFIYANDLKPVRQFHAIEGGCDKNRRAAFLARLISNHRPIQITEFQIPDNADKQRDLVLQLNEHYAIHAMNHFLDLPPGLFSVPGLNKVYSDLLFIFGHRDPQPESLVCIARVLTKVAEEKAAHEAANKIALDLQIRIDALEAKLAATCQG